MDSSVLTILGEIKSAIYWLLAVVTIGVIANWARAVVSIRSQLGKERSDLFAAEAAELYEKGKLDELLSHCECELASRPNSSYAIWYKARAHYGKRDFQQARKSLEGLESTEPTWRESHVKPFLERIRELENEAR